MEELLQDYEDKEIIKYLRFGWPINTVNTSVDTQVPQNQKSIHENRDKVIDYLCTELHEGAIVGPFADNPFGDSARFSPLGTREKKDDPTKIRIIHNLSFPFKGRSVNESIPKDEFLGEEVKLTYPGIDKLVDIILNKSEKGRKKVLIFKRDLTRAYRQIFIDVSFAHLVGFSFEGMVFFDLSLSMGLKISAYICQRITNSVIFIFRSQGYEALNYLDDLGGGDTVDRALSAYEALGQLLKNLRIKEAESKAARQQQS